MLPTGLPRAFGSFTSSTPSSTTVWPVYVFAPDRMTVPRPILVIVYGGATAGGTYGGEASEIVPPKSIDAADRPFWICCVPTAPIVVLPVRTTGPVQRDWPLTARTAPDWAA